MAYTKEMINFTYAKQKRGIGQYAFCSVHSRQTDEAVSFVSDQCTWQRVRETYANAVIHSGFLDWKESVINGMEYAIGLIDFNGKREIELLDVDGHIAHSDSTTMFIAGFLSVFNELQIALSEQDLGSIDALLLVPHEVFGIVSHVPIKFGSYFFPAIG